MPQTGDIIRTTIVQELGGRSMSNALYWQIDDLGTDPPLNQGLDDVVQAYWAVANDVCSDQWAVVCAIYENLTRVEAKVNLFTTLAGSVVDDSHPQDQVVRINQYAQPVAAEPPKRGAFNQSGVAEGLSTRGRVNNIAQFGPLVQFLRNQQVFGTNWTLQPQLRFQTAPGPPVVYGYSDMVAVQVSAPLFKLSSRKSRLCATG